MKRLIVFMMMAMISGGTMASLTLSTLPVSGVLYNDYGEPLSGQYDLQFYVYTTSTPTSAADSIHTEIIQTTIINGHYYVELGTGGWSQSLDFSVVDTYYLEVILDTGASGNGVIDAAETFAEKIPIKAFNYAQRSTYVDYLNANNFSPYVNGGFTNGNMLLSRTEIDNTYLNQNNDTAVNLAISSTLTVQDLVLNGACSGAGCASFGDIQGVTAGAGLSGGGNIGNINLNVADYGIENSMLNYNAVTSSRIANGAVGTDDLADGSVTSAKLAEDIQLDNLNASGWLSITGASTLTGNTSLGGNMSLSGASTLTGNASLGGTMSVSGASTLTGNASLGGTMSVTGSSTLTGNASLGGTMSVSGASTLTGNSTVGGTLSVSGASTLTGAGLFGSSVDIGGNTSIDGAATIGDVTGDSHIINGDVSLSADAENALTVQSNSNKNIFVGTNAENTPIIVVNQDEIWFDGNVNVTGDLTFGGSIGNAGTLDGLDSSDFVRTTADSTITGNLNLSLDLEVGRDATMAGNLNVMGDLAVGGSFNFASDTDFGGNVNVFGNLNAMNALFADDLYVTDDVVIGGKTTLTGNIFSTGSLNMNGGKPTTLSGTLVTYTDATIGGSLLIANGDLNANGDGTIMGSLYVDSSLNANGSGTLMGALYVDNNINANGDGTIVGSLYTDDWLNVNGNIVYTDGITGDNFFVADDSGNVNTTGTLEVGGDSTLAGGVTLGSLTGVNSFIFVDRKLNSNIGSESSVNAEFKNFSGDQSAPTIGFGVKIHSALKLTTAIPGYATEGTAGACPQAGPVRWDTTNKTVMKCDAASSWELFTEMECNITNAGMIILVNDTNGTKLFFCTYVESTSNAYKWATFSD